MSKVFVVGECDRIVYSAHESEAQRMVACGQARWSTNRRAIHLTGHVGEAGHGRTRTARGGLLAAIGRGQCYTISNRQGQVVGLKDIFPEDRGIFNAATIEAAARGFAYSFEAKGVMA